jgi:esterase/lipase
VDYDMDEGIKLYIIMLQEEAKNTLETGLIQEPKAQCMYIEQLLQRLALTKERRIIDSIQKYRNDQKELQKQMEEKQKETDKLMEEYTKNIREIYEMIKKL